jgi:hypothetical protein
MTNYYLFERFNRIDLRLLRRQDKQRYNIVKVEISMIVRLGRTLFLNSIHSFESYRVGPRSRRELDLRIKFCRVNAKSLI